MLNDKTGNVVNLKLVDPDNDDLIIIADNGITIRVKAGDVSKMGRNTQGVKIMRMKDATSKVSAFTVVPHDEGETTEAPAETAEQTAETAAAEGGETTGEGGQE